MSGYLEPPAIGAEAETLLGSLERMRATLRRLLVDFIEAYGRHTGPADLLREAIDGRVGEDPPGPASPFALGSS